VVHADSRTADTGSATAGRMSPSQGYRNCTAIKGPRQNSRPLKGDMKQVPQWGSTNSRRQRSKFSRAGFMQPCATCFGQCSCFVAVHFITLAGVFRHDRVRNCGAPSDGGL